MNPHGVLHYVPIVGRKNILRSLIEHGVEFVSGGRTFSFLLHEVKDRIREAIDGICEAIEECGKSFSERNTDYKTLYITGESTSCVRGAVDYMGSRLARKVEVVSPGIPFYNKPQFGPLFSLIDMALGDRENSSLSLLISRIFR